MTVWVGCSGWVSVVSVCAGVSVCGCVGGWVSGCVGVWSVCVGMWV